MAHGQITYYTNPTRSELKGTMPLLSTKVSVIDATVFKPPTGYCLEVSHTNRRLVLACTTIDEQEAWRRTLQKCTLLAHYRCMCACLHVCMFACVERCTNLIFFCAGG